jgi:ABC-type Fe3+-siderophore transport system permease subunit
MKSITIILAGFSIVMCLVLTYFLLFTELVEERLTGTNRLILVGVLIAYALFRSFRTYKLIKNKEYES